MKPDLFEPMPTKFKDLLNLYKKRRLSLGSLDETRFIPLMRDLGESLSQIEMSRWCGLLSRSLIGVPSW
jgi:hypothetical protein